VLRPALGSQTRNENRLTALIRTLIFETYLWIPLLGFLLVAVVNLATLFYGTERLLVSSGNHLLGAVAASFVFDSWGTLAGLVGAVILFAPILLGATSSHRRSIAAFFTIASVAIGIGSSLLWDLLFRNGNALSYGSSAIDIAAQSIIFTLAVYALIKSLIFDGDYGGDAYIRNSLRIIFGTLIVTTLWFILFLEPIFVPTDLYNWRVHEIAFICGAAFTVVYLAPFHALRKNSDTLNLKAVKQEASSLEQV
jgi:hypothetical protein